MTHPGVYLPGTQSMLSSRTSEAIGRNPDRRTGEVVSFTDGKLTVSVGGGDPEEVGYIDSYFPEPGDVVILILQRSTWVCLGRLMDTSAAAAPSSNGVNLFVPNPSNNTTNWVDITDATFEFTKRRTDSRVFASIAGSAWSDATGTAADFGFHINGVDSPLALHFYNTASVHHAYAGFGFFSGIPAGTYTVRGRFRRVTGTGTIRMDFDRCSLMCAEVD